MPLDLSGKADEATIPKPGDLHKITSIPAVNWIRNLQEQQIRAVGYPQPFIYLGARITKLFILFS